MFNSSSTNETTTTASTNGIGGGGGICGFSSLSSYSSNLTNVSDQMNTISLIISKLGHELEEIRLRALTSLTSKLDANILKEEDLVENRQLFIKLLELFNFPKFNQHEKVLNLLKKLLKHNSSIKIMQSINGLEFLNALENDLNEEELSSGSTIISKNLKIKIHEIIDLVNSVNSHSSVSSSISLTSSASLTASARAYHSEKDINEDSYANNTLKSSNMSKSVEMLNSESSLSTSSANNITNNSINASLTTAIKAALAVATSKPSLNKDLRSKSSLTSLSQSSISSSTSSSSSTSTIYSIDSNLNKVGSFNFEDKSNNNALTSTTQSNGFSQQQISNTNMKSYQQIPKINLENSHSTISENQPLTHNLDTLTASSIHLNSNRSSFSSTLISSSHLQQQQQNHSKGIKFSFESFTNINKNNNDNTKNNVTFVTGSTFYWLPLTQMDRKFLSTAENALSGNDLKKIKSYCTFLQTIVFNDFPAELFLQRSHILKLLVDLIIKSSMNAHHNNEDSEETIELIKSLIKCFNYYCAKLKKRIKYVKDPSIFCCFNPPSDDINSFQQDKDGIEDFELFSKSIYSSYYSTGSKISQNASLSSTLSSIRSTADIARKKLEKKFKASALDTQLSDTLSHIIDTKDNEYDENNCETDLNERDTIRANQEWPIHLFCFKLISTLIDNLSMIVISGSGSQQILPILCDTINTLIDILYETKHEWSHLNTSELLMNLFKKLNLNIKYSIQQHSTTLTNSHVLHRLVYIYLVTILQRLINLMHSTNETSLLMPVELSEQIFFILNDTSLINSSFGTDLTSVFSAILCHLDKTLYDIYELSNEICDSMKSACDFLIKTSDLKSLFESKLGANLDELILLAKKSLSYMEYHECKLLPNKIVKFVSALYRYHRNTTNEDNLSSINNQIALDIEELITSCMTSKSEQIKTETYQALYTLVDESLDLKLITTATSQQQNEKLQRIRCEQISFLLNNKIFYNLIQNGLFDMSCLKVRQSSQNILIKLLKCELVATDSFKDKLTQLIVIYMPYIQCLATFTSPVNNKDSISQSIGQLILKLSDSSTNFKHDNDEANFLIYLTPIIERLRCSLRYLYAKEKTIRKKGFEQTIEFFYKLSKIANNANNSSIMSECDSYRSTTEMNNTNLNDFFLKFLPERFCDLIIGDCKTKRKTRTFQLYSNDQQKEEPIFKTENLYRVFNIFTSDQVDIEVKENAAKQLAIMIGTGDKNLHKAFINSDGVNVCIRYLRKTLFMHNNIDGLNFLLCKMNSSSSIKLQASCISCLCNIIFWNKDIRKLYLFEMDFYKLILKCLFNSFNFSGEKTLLYTEMQEDMSIILFILLFNQVSSLDYYYNCNDNKIADTVIFDLSKHLKENYYVPFNLTNQQQIITVGNEYEINSKLKNLIKLKNNQQSSVSLSSSSFFQNSVFQQKDNTLSTTCLSINNSISTLLDAKFRITWNINWHGGSLTSLCHDLISNENLISTSNQIEFNKILCLNDNDKLSIQHTQPFYLFKHLCASINASLTHQDALNTFDLIQVLILIVTINHIDSDELMCKYFNRLKCDWHLFLNRFTHKLPSLKSKLDQHLYAYSFETIRKMLDLQLVYNNAFNYSDIKSDNSQLLLLSPPQPSISLDKWLYDTINSNSSSLVQMLRIFLGNYEQDEIRINSLILSLCAFIRVYYNKNRLIKSETDSFYYVPAKEIVKICVEQMQACEIDKFRNLNKLAILIKLTGSFLNPNLPVSSDKPLNEEISQLFIQLMKSLVQIINTFNVGRGGLSLSFMGNFITKSAHVSLLQFVKNGLINSSTQKDKLEIVKAVLCIKDETNNSLGSSWLIPLMLHRETQIRSISFSLISLLINVPFARRKLFAHETGGIWSIALNVLLNRSECSLVRAQACAFLINLTSSIKENQKINPTSTNSKTLQLHQINKRNPEDDISNKKSLRKNIEIDGEEEFSRENEEENETENDEEDICMSITNLELVLHGSNFYSKIAQILTSFYPYETYSLNELKQKQNSKSTNNISICSPTLVSSICQLLFNLCVLLRKEACTLISDSGIIKLLISYVKPINLLTCTTNNNEDQEQNDKSFKLNQDLIDMLREICIFLNAFYSIHQYENNSSLTKDQIKLNNNLIYDLVACLNLNTKNIPDKHKLKPFYSTLFDLLCTFLNSSSNNEIIETYLIIISKCWVSLSKYLINELLCDTGDDDNIHRLHENNVALRFYTIYLSKLTFKSNSSKNIQIISDNISFLFDESENESTILGELLCKKLIKKFDKYFLASVSTTNTTTQGELSILVNYKLTISNLLKCLFSLSSKAKHNALNNGLIETLIEHLKYTHSKLNLRSLNTTTAKNQVSLVSTSLLADLKETLLILNYLMCSNEIENQNDNEIKQLVTKYNLHTIIHSFWCWTLQDDGLLKAALLTLCTLTANNKLSINLMTQSNVSAQTATMSVSNDNTGGMSLLNSVIKTLQKTLKSKWSLQNNSSNFLQIQKYSFALLTNCAQSSECKNIIWKSNLLVDFTSIELNNINSILTSNNGSPHVKLWLKFLLSLSFSQDGQQFFMKVEALLTTIIKLVELILKHNVQQQQMRNFELKELHYICLLIMRNLAFNSANKSKLISIPEYVNIIVNSLKNKNEKIQILALSAIDSLIYDYNKAKVILKNSNVLKYLVELGEMNTKFISLSNNADHKKNYFRILSIINNLIKVLNE